MKETSDCKKMFLASWSPIFETSKSLNFKLGNLCSRVGPRSRHGLWNGCYGPTENFNYSQHRPRTWRPPVTNGLALIDRSIDQIHIKDALRAWREAERIEAIPRWTNVRAASRNMFLRWGENEDIEPQFLVSGEISAKIHLDFAIGGSI
jgi:hypothetical protein